VGPVTVRPDGTEPADAILDATDAVGATLVVLGSRKRSSMGTFLMGSTTQRVLLDAPVPVLVVKDHYDR
jgi:nucleotide-binding universal stress UspA family protein